MEDAWRSILHRRVDANKYDFGHVLVIGGGDGMEGAPLLVAEAAMRVGAGLVTIATTAAVADRIAGDVEEVMVRGVLQDVEATLEALRQFMHDHPVDAVVIGPGLEAKMYEFIRRFLSEITLPTVVDAAALRALSGHLELLSSSIAEANPNLVLTPHGGEFMSLAKQERAGKKEAEDFTKQYAVTLVLKGNPTFVASKGETYINTTNGPELATAGTGDVLAGVIASIIGQGIAVTEAAKMAVYIHGVAGNIAAKEKTEAGVMAGDVIDAMPQALRQVSGE